MPVNQMQAVQINRPTQMIFTARIHPHVVPSTSHGPREQMLQGLRAKLLRGIPAC